jgi:hypothetical protein
MFVELIRDLKSKMIEHGTEPKFIWMSESTRFTMLQTAKEIFYTDKANANIETVEGLTIRIDEQVPNGQIFLSGEEFDIDATAEDNRNMERSGSRSLN